MIRLSRTCWNWCGSAKTSGSPDGERLEDRDVAEALFVRAERERLAHHLVQIDHGAGRVTFTGEGEQVAHDLGGAFRFAQDRLEAAPRLIVHAALRQAFGPRQDRRERIVQLVGDAGDRLAERREFLGLQELVIQVAGLVLEAFPLADVAHQRFDAQPLFDQGFRVSRHFHPHGRAIRTADAQQVVGDRPVAPEPFQERLARERIDELIDLERADVPVRRLRGEPEHEFQVGVGRQRRGCVPPDRADVDPLVHGLEEPGERLGRSGGCKGLRAHRAQGSQGSRLRAEGAKPSTRSRLGPVRKSLRDSGRRCIPPRGVARRSHAPGMVPPRALRSGRLGIQNHTLISGRALTCAPVPGP